MAEQRKLGIFSRQFILASVALFCYLTLGLMWPIQEPLEPGFDDISRFGDGSAGGKAGGDRVVLDEIAFQSNLQFVAPSVLGDFNLNVTLDVNDIDLLE